MYAIARNVLKDWYRKNDPMKQAQDLTGVETTFTDGMNEEEHIQLAERKLLLEKALQKLVPEQREAIVLNKGWLWLHIHVEVCIDFSIRGFKFGKGIHISRKGDVYIAMIGTESHGSIARYALKGNFDLSMVGVCRYWTSYSVKHNVIMVGLHLNFTNYI